MMPSRYNVRDWSRHMEAYPLNEPVATNASRLLGRLLDDPAIHPDARGFLLNAGLWSIGHAGFDRPPVPGYEVEPGVPL